MAAKAKEQKKPKSSAKKVRPTGRFSTFLTMLSKKMIKVAKKRGYVTMDELDAVLPSEEVTSEQIEDTMAMLSDMGINVVEDDEQEADRDDNNDDDAEEGGDLVEATGTAVAATTTKNRPTVRMIRCACICAKWVPSSFCRARAKLPSQSVSEAGRETMIAGLY